MFDDFGSRRILSGTSLSKSATGEAWGHKDLVKLCLATAKVTDKGSCSGEGQ